MNRSLCLFVFGGALRCLADSAPGSPSPLEVTPVAPVSLEARGNVWFADFGRAAYGNLRITFRGPVPAGKLAVRLGEKLDGTGAIDRKPPGSVNYREIELVTREGQLVYQPTIPSKEFHRGAASAKTPPSIGEVTPFRYAEIENAPETLASSSLRQLAVHAPFDDDASSFECSDPTLNAVWRLCKHTMKATTAFGVYIDGERERIPYEADAYINLLSHYACDLDPRVGRATFAHLLAHPTWPTEWSLHMPMIADADYEATGDPVLAARHYAALKGKLLPNKAGPDGLLHASAIVDWPAGERDGYNDGIVDPRERKQVGPEVNTVANAFHYQALRCMARLASALGKADDARDFASKADRVSAAFEAAFFDPARGVYIDGVGSDHASLHANMLPLAFGLVPSERQATVVDFVRSRGMACSVYGAQYLLEALYRADRADDALRLMTSHAERGWWHMIELGSTMTLEAWDAKAKPNLTWNHAWGAAPAHIIMRYLVGVRPIAPGSTRILIAPRPGSLRWFKAKVPTARGPVLAGFNRAPRFALEIVTPPGTVASVSLPLEPGAPARQVFMDGKPATVTPAANALVVEDVQAGPHLFEIP